MLITQYYNKELSRNLTAIKIIGLHSDSKSDVYKIERGTALACSNIAVITRLILWLRVSPVVSLAKSVSDTPFRDGIEVETTDRIAD